MNSQQAKINGQIVNIQDGETILQAAKRLGIEIPTLCYSEGMHPEGGCRMCLVESNQKSLPVGACHTPIQAGMEIQTHTPKLEALRRDILSLYLDDEQPVFQGNGKETKFTGLLQDYQLKPISDSQAVKVDNSHPYLSFNPDTCITCRLCLNACEQIQGQFVYGISGRGSESRLVFGAEESFADSPCVACGACVDLCPTGAITDRDRLNLTPADSVTETVCGYCGVGCRLEVESAQGKVLRINPVEDAVVNQGHLCVKGRYAHSYHHSSDRLTQPLKRVGEEFQPISWDEALDLIAEKLLTIKADYGADALGAFSSSRSTNEAAYLLQKLFRSLIKTNNVDCCARVCHSSTALGLRTVTGAGAASASYVDIEKAKCIVIAGANPTEAHPVVGARIKQAVLNGARLVVIDPRRIELAEYADIHLQLLPGTNVPLFNALAKVLIAEDLIDRDYLNERVEGFEEFCTFLNNLSLEEIASITTVETNLICEAARLIGSYGQTLFVHGLGLSELTQGTASVMTLCNLGMLTGSIGREGAGMLPLRGQNNVQGNADMGGMPNLITGYQPLNNPELRQRLESLWGGVPPEEPGLTIPEMIDAAARGDIHALWIQGEDVVQSDNNETHVREALSNLDFLVVQELFFSETCQYAHVILPAAAALEQEGTFTNGERRIQHVRPAVPPPGEARPDWEAIRDVAVKIGANWNYQNPGEVMDEIAQVAPNFFGGVSYTRLKGDGLQWPCPSSDHPGTVTVHAEHFIRGKGQLVTIDYIPSPEHGVAGYPFLLITGRLLEHYNVGTMTRRTPNQELVTEDVLEIHPADANREHIADGEPVNLESRWGSTTVKAKHSRRIAPNTLFLSFHYPETHTNRITGPHLDPKSKCPQYKAVAVRLQPNKS
ncbi:MAG: formate dehydrogenase subunit alpha [Xenococcaceae cyanobacterium MO_188.B29]|nr:formate dehydrogenase subunit alpha [Xenococcaceae cyanobacterium MO_188.B29]